MHQARVEFFLDNGWSLIGRLHQWMSRWPHAADDRTTLIDVIHGVQSLWAVADDLGLKRLARISLTLEQVLERICARTLEFTAERMEDITAGVGCFQEMLLGFEATREEPAFPDLKALLRLERHTTEAIWAGCDPIARNDLPTDATSPDISPSERQSSDLIELEGDFPKRQPQVEIPDSIDSTLLTMLNQFVVKIDDTCRQLHARMLSDEAPYVTTSSRLEHLSQTTRLLVNQLIQQTGGADFIDVSIWTESALRLPGFDDPAPILVSTGAHFLPLNAESGEPTVEIDDWADFCQQELLVAENSPLPETPDVMKANLEIEVIREPQRILIVEDSLFFRNLIGLVVQSAGYDPQSVKSIIEAVDVLDQTSDFRAVVIGSDLLPELAATIARCRQTHAVKVISLESNEDHWRHDGHVDDHVLKSRPGQLTAVLDRLLNDPMQEQRLSA